MYSNYTMFNSFVIAFIASYVGPPPILSHMHGVRGGMGQYSSDLA